MDEWENLKLDDLGRIVTGKTPLTSVEGNFGGQIPFVTPSDMDGRKTISTTARNLTEAGAASVKGSKIPAGSVMVSCIGSDMGKAFIAGRDCVTNQQINSIIVNECFCNEFVYYNLSTRKDEIRHQAAGGSAQPILNKGDFSRLEITLPPLLIQKSIAKILGDLDNKIELNRRMNATLEAMARALFQSWFVDFDPVRAKMDGRKPVGMDEETAKLFSDSFEESEMGLIPKGWKVKTVGEIGEIICGKTPPTGVPDYYGDDVPFITIPDMHGNVFGASTARRLSHAGANSQANKTLPPGSICVSCIATPGLVVITSEKSQTNQQINSVIPHEENETYFWYWVMTGLGAEIASSGSGGSVLTNLSKGRFEMLNVIKPTHNLIAAYHSEVSPLFQNILANTHQSRTIATLRDTLLPKLLNGELRL